MSDQEKLMSQLNTLQESAKNMFEMIELQKGKLPFEIAPDCTQHKASWWDADEFAKFLGNGWRLPTRNEVPQLCDFRDVGVKFYGNIWTSETINEDLYDDFNIWAVNVETGEEEQCDAFSYIGVVLVRDRSND
jgi:hypothetical protein